MDTSKKVLIAYGSRYGSTEEIARVMAETLKKEGLKTHLLDLRHTKQKQWPPLASFDGLLVGSGIRIRWVSEATTFLKKHVEELKALKAKGLIVSVFISCGTASIPGKLEEARQNYVEKVLAEVGITNAVDTYDAFGGVFDLSPSAPIGFLDKKMFAAGARAMSKDSGLQLTEEARNDLRDWDQIRAFAEHFAELVKAERNN